MAQSAGAAKYTNCISAEGEDSPNECPEGDAPVMLKLWGIRSISSLPSPPGQLWSRWVAPDRVLSMGQIELNCVLMLNWIVWNRTVYICIKMDLALNNLQWLVGHKTKPNLLTEHRICWL